MGWQVRYSPRAAKAMRKLDKPVARRVFDALERLATLEDPTAPCKALSGPLTGLWRPRIGDYRAVLDIRRDDVVIIALDLGHRSSVYDD
ncbi:type II toxin-antitoxin system RelE family toxin [Arsenicicoccus dermatophilus]|uniref:type II toxin-antitoxin system RelE family toxin n=1 Tax=Arsenicicoccus dermatophilus TaxID=1076331 RepID=UPI001F4CD106|nr:type II toxin-antitoxin system RelE/ParE family toxin [Arsenicicoccus dermatophilus]MCH8614383.1 type II toxin-antitoxin system RelE/ParE family toxin [Arsenicicoccus dermatophilus]